MPLNENDLKDVLAERARIPTARAGRVAEVRRRIRRRKAVKTATAVVAAAAAVTVVVVAAPMLDGRNDTNGLTVVGSPSKQPSPSPDCVRPGSALRDEAPKGKATVMTTCPEPNSTVPAAFPPAKYSIEREGDAYRVTIPEMGDLEGLRRELRELGIPAVESPSPGFGDCPVNDTNPHSFGGASVPTPGVWEFVVSPKEFDANREVGISNDPDGRVIGMLLFQHWCRTK